MENVSPWIPFPPSLYPKYGHFQCDSVYTEFIKMGFGMVRFFLLNIYLENGELGWYVECKEIREHGLIIWWIQILLNHFVVLYNLFWTTNIIHLYWIG